MNFFEVLIDFIYPEKNICFICDEHYKGIKNNLCNECREKLPVINHVFNEGIICSLRYEGIVKDLIYKYKYGKCSYLYKLFGNIMTETFLQTELKNIDIIVPIPLHRTKKAKRGFNQSELLASYIAKKLDIDMDGKNLCRIKKTKSQSGLTKRERHKNIEGAFKVIDKDIFLDKTILIVDDIFTSGSTYAEASNELLKCGAKKTYLITIATGRDLL